MGMEARQLAAAKPYPLVFEPMVLEKVWGGDRIARWRGAAGAGGKKYGESWEIADLAATSESGAGGGAMQSVVISGPLKGMSVGEAMAAVGGPRPFPLLIKYLDAMENLSVQVHPSEAVAKRDPGAHLKTESWYVVEAAPGSSLYIGLKPGVTREGFAAALRSSGRTVPARHPAVEMMVRIEARAGMCFTLPSGIVHALGAGVLVAEVQTPSDTTYRLYDWGREGREMHIEAGLASAFGADGEQTVRAAPSAGPMADGELCLRLAETAFYTIDEVRPLPGDEVTVGFPCRYAGKHAAIEEKGFVLMTVAGRGELAAAEGGFETMPMAPGLTAYVPPACVRETVLRAGDGLRVLRVGVRGRA